MKLEEFRLESYDERMVLQLALRVFCARDPDMYQKEVAALAARLSATECQPGGCTYCNADARAEAWDDA